MVGRTTSRVGVGFPLQRGPTLFLRYVTSYTLIPATARVKPTFKKWPSLQKQKGEEKKPLSWPLLPLEAKRLEFPNASPPHAEQSEGNNKSLQQPAALKSKRKTLVLSQWKLDKRKRERSLSFPRGLEGRALFLPFAWPSFFIRQVALSNAR